MSAAVDPVASLGNWELEVELAGRTFVLLPRSAAEWLTVLVENPMDPSLILPGMLDADSQDALEDALLAGRVTVREIEDMALEVVGQAAGRDWWWVLRLVQAMVGSWTTVHGTLITQGVRLETMPLGAALSAIYVTCASRMDEEHRRLFDRDLEMPPAAEEIDDTQEAENFLALMNSSR